MWYSRTFTLGDFVLVRARSENEKVPEPLLELAERTEASYETVECIHDIGEDPSGLFFHYYSRFLTHSLMLSKVTSVTVDFRRQLLMQV